MKCPICEMDGYIEKASYRVEGDSTEETETKLFRVLSYSCRNKQCGNFGKTIGKAELPLPVDKTD